VDFRIKKGFDINLAGKPLTEVSDAPVSDQVAVFPLEFDRLKQRLKVQEGDKVKCGTELMEDKANPEFKLRAPAAGEVIKIIRGARRFVEKIVIKVDAKGESEDFGSFAADKLTGLDRETALKMLTTTGYLALIRQRPFGRMADAAVTPKSIFVNAMNTGPFQADAEVVVSDDPAAFQAGIDVMNCLADGKVHLCVGANAGSTLKGVGNVERHTFTGPHPAGNSSVHIDRVDPMVPTDVVWTVKAVDLVAVGRLFLDGKLPQKRIVALGGPSVQAGKFQHYRLPVGAELKPLFDEALCDCENRIIDGDVLSGTTMPAEPYLRFCQSVISVIPVDRERHMLGWTMPGFTMFSFSRLFVSSWLPRRMPWRLGTSLHGEERAMVLTGNYDKVVPLNIMVDYLVRAVLAGDTDEAISLGILETLPEDFALCDFICPSKIEVQDIIRDGLRQIEEEGI
jgi:Na+-transporting NADH:ubiquinone oxidoreductase subunit A